jgi:hypothetical protein
MFAQSLARWISRPFAITVRILLRPFAQRVARLVKQLIQPLTNKVRAMAVRDFETTLRAIECDLRAIRRRLASIEDQVNIAGNECSATAGIEPTNRP